MLFKTSFTKVDRNKEALEVLLKGLQVDGETGEIWELACGIVNKAPALAEMSLDRTEEAVKCHPDSDVINVRHEEWTICRSHGLF